MAEAEERDTPPPAAPVGVAARASRASPERDSGFDATSQSSTSSGKGEGARKGGQESDRKGSERRSVVLSAVAEEW